MRQLLYLFHFLFQIKDMASANCTAGWTDLGSGICQSPTYGPSPQYEAYAACASLNAYMPTITNAFENSNVIMLWLGVTCTSSQPTSCLWDNGVAVTDTSYTNFAPGHPNMTIGACVYISSAGYWYSKDCSQSPYHYVCRTAPGVYVPKCASPAYYFRGHCYYPISAQTYGDAVGPCNANCGHIASIHNDGENSYVRDIANTHAGAAYTFIGMTYTNGAYKWDDGTQMNYDKFGLRSPGLGSCVLMATVEGDVVAQGQWMSSECSDLTIAVCKTDVTCSIATEAPPTCTDVQYFSGKGMIFSPNYPLGSGPNHCQYIITEGPNVTVAVTFLELSLDRSSTIKMYNSPLDTTPFMTFNTNSKADNGSAYFTSGNFLKILFDTSGDINFKNMWKISYDKLWKEGFSTFQAPTKLATTIVEISGPHTAMNCTYNLRMGTTTGRTCIRLSSFDVRSGDTISMYDGAVNPQNRIAFFTSSSSTPYPASTTLFYPALCTSTSNYMTIVTTGQSGLGYEMFELTAADSPEILNPGPLLFTYSATAAVPASVGGVYNPGTYGYGFRTTDPNGRVMANFTYLSMSSPDFIFIMDGDNTATVALAYGSLVNSRMIYQTSGQRLGMLATFYSGVSPVGYRAYFTAV